MATEESIMGNNKVYVVNPKNSLDPPLPSSSSIDSSESMDMKHRNTKGIHWIVCGIFIVGEMAGGGIVAMPLAVVQTGLYIGIAAILLGAVISGYTGIQLGNNWTLMQRRWPMYREHCRDPYPEMARRALGDWASTFVRVVLCVSQFGILVVFLILSSNNLSSIIHSWFSSNFDSCLIMLILAVALLPVLMLKSPKDFWQAAIAAAASTTTAMVLVMIGAGRDSGTCRPHVDFPQPEVKSIFLSYGTIMFAYGGHACFPTFQHDMRKPYLFNRSVWFSYAVIVAMYMPVAVYGYLVYGGSLTDNVTISVQTTWIRQTVTVLITIHVITTIVIVFSPLAHTVEQLFSTPHKFSVKRFVVRTAIFLSAVFVAESVPKFGVFLDLVGGSTITLLTMTLPSVFYLYLHAAETKRIERAEKKKGAESESGGEEDTEFATFRDIIRYTPRHVLFFNLFCLIVGILGGIAATVSAITALFGANMQPPCYIRPFLNNPNQGSPQSFDGACCGKYSNLTSPYFPVHGICKKHE